MPKLNSETFDKTIAFLSEVVHSINVLKIGQLISEAGTDEERIALSNALTSLLQTNNSFGYNNGFDTPYY